MQWTYSISKEVSQITKAIFGELNMRDSHEEKKTDPSRHVGETKGTRKARWAPFVPTVPGKMLLWWSVQGLKCVQDNVPLECLKCFLFAYVYLMLGTRRHFRPFISDPAVGGPRVYNTHVQISWNPWETTFKTPFVGSTMKVPGSLPCSWWQYIYNTYICIFRYISYMDIKTYHHLHARIDMFLWRGTQSPAPKEHCTSLLVLSSWFYLSNHNSTFWSYPTADNQSSECCGIPANRPITYSRAHTHTCRLFWSMVLSLNWVFLGACQAVARL